MSLKSIAVTVGCMVLAQLVFEKFVRGKFV
jgi:hypothetical protein